MRIWTIHPRYLDRMGLLAVWREGLLAQAVLLGRTKGYIHHPQLFRFREQVDPVAAIATYLASVNEEAQQRGYQFDRSRIHHSRIPGLIFETEGQLCYEWGHLKRKLQIRSPQQALEFIQITMPDPHPLFEIIPGEVRGWEKR